MALKTTDINSDFSFMVQDRICLLPTTLLDDPNSSQYHSNSLSFFKYANEELKLAYLNTPDALLEQRSGEWFAPAMLLTAQFCAQYPLTVSVLCNILSNYIYDTFKGRAKPQVRLTLILEKKMKSTYVQIDYTGDIEGLNAVQTTIDDLMK